MKIVDRKTFLSMPENTLFSKYDPCWFNSMEIKGHTIGDNDFFLQELTGSIAYNNAAGREVILDRAAKTGCHVDMDFDSYGRDGMFDDALFAVYEKEDIEALIERLKKCL